MDVRVSKVSVMEVLRKYLSEELARDIMGDIEYAECEEMEAEIGMTYGEWKERFSDEHDVVWAKDSGAGFGRKGWTVYGDCDDMQIVQIDTVGPSRKKVLHLWYAGRKDWRD